MTRAGIIAIEPNLVEERALSVHHIMKTMTSDANLLMAVRAPNMNYGDISPIKEIHTDTYVSFAHNFDLPEMV